MPLSSTTKGLLACLTAAVLWASNGVAAKYLMNDGLSPFVLAQGRVVLGSGLTFIWLALTRPSALKIRLKDLPLVGLLAGANLAFINGAYLAAISKIPVAAAIFIQYMAPAVIALLAWKFMGERMTRLKLVALGLAIAGCFLVAGVYDLDLLSLNRTGILWSLVSIFGFSGYCLLSEYGLRTYGPWTVLSYALLFAGVSWSAVLGPGQIFHLGHDALSWILVAYSVTLGTVIPFGLFFYGIQHLRATRATIISAFEPIAAGLIAFIFLGESLELLQVAGGLAVVGAVVIIQKEREQDQLAPAHVRDRQAAG